MARDPRNFIVETQDYPMDFIVGYWTTDISSSDYNVITKTVAHGLGYTPLLFGSYSLDNGSTWLPVGLNDYYTNQSDCWVEADATNIYVNFTNLKSGSRTAKVKLWGFMPTTADRANDAPDNANAFFLNTNFNYSKLVKAGRWGFSTGSNKLLATHDLGYKPEVLVWAETSNGRIAPLDIQFSNHTDWVPDHFVYVTDSGLYATNSSADYHSSTLNALHYRIYGAENG